MQLFGPGCTSPLHFRNDEVRADFHKAVSNNATHIYILLEDRGNVRNGIVLPVSRWILITQDFNLWGDELTDPAFPNMWIHHVGPEPVPGLRALIESEAELYST